LGRRAASGNVPAREGVLRLMDETRAAGLALGVCSAATRSSAVAVVENLLGRERYEARSLAAPAPGAAAGAPRRVSAPVLRRRGARELHCGIVQQALSTLPPYGVNLAWTSVRKAHGQDARHEWRRLWAGVRLACACK